MTALLPPDTRPSGASQATFQAFYAYATELAHAGIGTSDEVALPLYPDELTPEHLRTARRRLRTAYRYLSIMEQELKQG